jgi:hypothetical protein
MKDCFIRFLIFFVEILKCIFIGLFLLVAFIGLILFMPIAIAVGLMVLPICLIYFIKVSIDDIFYGERE